MVEGQPRPGYIPFENFGLNNILPLLQIPSLVHFIGDSCGQWFGENAVHNAFRSGIHHLQLSRDLNDRETLGLLIGGHFRPVSMIAADLLRSMLMAGLSYRYSNIFGFDLENPLFL